MSKVLDDEQFDKKSASLLPAEKGGSETEYSAEKRTMVQLLSRKIIKAMGRRKTLAEARKTEEGAPTLRRTLTASDLVLYGVGSSVGAGIYVMIGLGANIAGPAISLSFLGCGLACILTSLAYAEFASRIPVAGSAFVYTFVAFGEFAAFLVGWNLILGYGFTTSGKLCHCLL